MKGKETGADRRTVVRNTGVVGSGTVVNRVLGLLRDAVLAFIFGATAQADAFFVAFRIPNLMRQLFGEGALAASFVPVYTDVRQRKGEEAARRFTGNILFHLVVVLSVLTAGGVLFAPLLVRAIALGFDPSSEVFRVTVLLTRWMLPYMIFICVAALGMGVLNSHDHFLIPAAAPALLNLSIIVFALVISPGLDQPVLALAVGVLFGGILQMLVQYPPMKAMKVTPAPARPLFTAEIRRMAVMMGPAVLGVTIYQVNILVDTILASFLPRGSISYLWYGNRMMQFPLGVFGVALATAALPTLSRQIAQDRRDDFLKTVSFALGLTAFIGFPAALGLMGAREPIMAALFGRGAFGAEDVAGSGRALLYYASGLPFFIGVKILSRAFFALENTRIPFAAAGMAFLVNALLDVTLMGPMGHAGLALATSLASLANFLILARAFTRRMGASWMDRDLIREIITSCAGALVMLAALNWAAGTIPWMSLSGLERLVMLAGCVALGFGVYLTATFFFGSKGLKMLIKTIFQDRST